MRIVEMRFKQRERERESGRDIFEKGGK